MRVIIDRFEGDYAVVEISEGKFVNLPNVLVAEAEEGDVVEITVNRREANKKKAEIQEIVDRLFQ